MRLSTKGRFAVTAMIDVGLRDAFGPVSLNDLEQRIERAERIDERSSNHFTGKDPRERERVGPEAGLCAHPLATFLELEKTARGKRRRDAFDGRGCVLADAQLPREPCFG